MDNESGNELSLLSAIGTPATIASPRRRSKIQELRAEVWEIREDQLPIIMTQAQLQINLGCALDNLAQLVPSQPLPASTPLPAPHPPTDSASSDTTEP